MIISDLELFLIELPSSEGPNNEGHLRSLVVHVISNSGAEGWGETRKAWRLSELPARRKALLAVLAGREAYDLAAILELDVLADRALACGLEMALWDLIARSAQVPLCQLLGGEYRRSVPLSVSLPAGPPETVAQWARALAAQAIGSQTIRSTGSLEDDLRLIGTVAETCSHRVQLRFDAQQHYDLRGATHLCSRLEPGSVEFVLDPLAKAQADLISTLRATARVALAAHATIDGPSDVMQIARGGAVAFALVDPVKVGGLTRSRHCAVVAEAGGIQTGLRMEGTSGLAVAASLHLAAATPSFAGGHECSYPKLHDDILADPLRLVDGMLEVPLAAGLGIEIDRDKIERYQVEY